MVTLGCTPIFRLDSMKFFRRAQRKLVIETRRLSASLRLEPNLFIIGAQKAGTTSLAGYLGQHPDTTPALRKEIRYFNANYHHDISWYQSHFPLKQHQSSSVVFEASPGYIVYPCVPNRIKEHYPQARIIALLRHPIARAYSHYKMNLRRPQVGENLSFAEAIAAEDERLKDSIAQIHDPAIGYNDSFEYFSYSTRGRYHEQLKCWYELFDPSQIMVIQAERFFEHTASVYQDVLEFLHLPQWQPRSFPAHNQSGASQSLRDKIGIEAYEKLSSYFQPHNQALYNLLGRNFDWD